MKGSKALFSHKSDDWATPPWLLAGLEWWFGCKFFDPCPLGGSGGFDVPWGIVPTYINPPYSECIAWVARAAHEGTAANHPIVMLLPARTDTRWFHDYVLPHAQQFWFLRGRLKFGGSKNSAPFPSMVVIFGRLF